MDHLERFYRHLVRTIRASHPQYLSQPFEVAELYQTIMPYRHHRRELGFDTNQDYEMAVLELLSAKGGFLIVEDQMREALTRELASPNPDPGAFREYATSSVQLSPDALRNIEPASADVISTSKSSQTTRAAAARTSTSAPATDDTLISRTEPEHGSMTAIAEPTTSARMSPDVAADPGDRCRYCSGDIPRGRRVTFCPHCGQNLTVVNCMACGTELELGWKFCTTCGRPNTVSASS